MSVEIVIGHDAWRAADGLEALITDVIAAALARMDDPRPGVAVILLADDAMVRDLNARFRGKDRPTNVLSFPAPQSEGYPGDVALAYQTCAREADEAGKTLVHHAAHLALHGVLHLNGFDHQEDAAAREMETLETAVLAGFAIPDPYAAQNTP
ncbi:rRNA maturation RNase YbeY [Alkalicaulis satelles]|uniref:Endoribonuclease YbeY n=1 Tax=Alkalicaulis satelles TaxID=2609175 RepID=A0A5M6ZGP2_9PROT|nr:rRNA maturation RNase YbeY [Alkalicaulis satelles]KAA5803480.1 rRNA maturation RNase YbeY [Alkalicaulis satelles]